MGFLKKSSFPTQVNKKKATTTIRTIIIIGM